MPNFFSFTEAISRGLRWLGGIFLMALKEIGALIFQYLLMPLYRFWHLLRYLCNRLLPEQPNRTIALLFLLTGAGITIGVVIVDRTTDPIRGDVLTEKSLAGLFLNAPEDYDLPEIDKFLEEQPASENISTLPPTLSAPSYTNALPALPIAPEQTFLNSRTDILKYEVKTGDTIESLAQKFNITPDTIRWANRLTAKTKLKVGQTLIVLPVSGLQHTVRRGETVSSIARLYSVDRFDVLRFNGFTDDRSLKIGTMLIIPHGKPPAVIARQPRPQAGRPLAEAPPPFIASPEGIHFIWPIDSRRLTQYFTWRHFGIDLGTSSGLPVRAAEAGVVIKAQRGWNGGYGTMVMIDHGAGFKTLYGHNSNLLVKVGDHISRGQTIAHSGNTGRSTGPHLHFEVWKNNRRVNPLSYVR